MRPQELGSKLAMHVVAARPLCLDKQSVPEDAIAGVLLCPLAACVDAPAACRGIPRSSMVHDSADQTWQWGMT